MASHWFKVNVGQNSYIFVRIKLITLMTTKIQSIFFGGGTKWIGWNYGPLNLMIKN
jgi:hypothetical protein